MLKHFSSFLTKQAAQIKVFWQKNWWHKAVICLFVFIFVCLAGMYGVARWYIASEQHKPLVIGTSFIPAYAESLGLDPKVTLHATLTDLGMKHLRLVSYWDQMEPSPGSYDFSALDWQFSMVEASHAHVSLALGLRQPRWPECHLPSWAANESASVWQPQLSNFITAIVQHYKNSPALESYQLENEYFLRGFGNCTNFDRNRLVSEFALVKQLDPNHPVIIARSNNALGIPVGKPTPDEFGISIYKRVWSPPIGRYIEYPFPAWYYASLAGFQKITTGRDMIIHELQAEAWPPNEQSITATSLMEQNKSFDATRFSSRIAYGEATGMRSMYLWGSEYWYYRMVALHDPSLWNVARQAVLQSQQ